MGEQGADGVVERADEKGSFSAACEPEPLALELPWPVFCFFLFGREDDER